MKYGYFSKDALEFIITTPLTPRPWINYLTNEKYCAIISQCAGGYSFYQDCRTNRILRWYPSSWHFDRPGRYIYAKECSTSHVLRRTSKKDKDAKLGACNAQRIWSLTYQPIREKPDFFEARHGLGYTAIKTKYSGVFSEVTYFVPHADDCELWLVRLTNKTNKQKKLEIYPYAEWLLGDYHEELRYRNIMNLYNRIWYDGKSKAIFAKKTAFWKDLNIQPFKYLAFFASSLTPKGHVTIKDKFLGKYNTEERPQMLLDGRFRNEPECSGEDGIACFRHDIRLEPGEIKEFVVILGQTEPANVNPLISKYRDLKTVKRELDATKQLWKKRILDNVIISTPDKNFDLLVNVWLKYQLYICNFWSRSPSYYHEGSGGRGYRDSCQDSEAILSLNPGFARKRILKIASLIRHDGTSAAGWSDTFGPAGQRPNKDHQIWLTSTISAYIRETGDKDILKEFAPYLKDRYINGWDTDINHKGGSTTEGEGTLFEHLEKNLNFTFNDVGEKGLPLIGHADWNDAIDAAGKKLRGESVWLAQALVRSLKMLAELANLIGEHEKCDDFLNKAKTMTQRINDIGWDGNWYRRGFTDGGTIYGSNTNNQGKIFLNTQAWALLAQITDDDREDKILKSVKKYLDGEYGFALFYPAYSKFAAELGRISMFSEGTKENAAVFAHAATFMITGLCMAGKGSWAYEAMCKLFPNKQKDYDLYKTEPYSYAEYLVGPGHPYLYGEGAFTWVTGSSGWTFMCVTEWLLGARRDFDGLRIDPCIPAHWKKCSIRRPFRGAVYEIAIDNNRGVEKGVKEVYVDGELIAGNIIKPHCDGRVHKVKVTMG